MLGIQDGKKIKEKDLVKHSLSPADLSIKSKKSSLRQEETGGYENHWICLNTCIHHVHDKIFVIFHAAVLLGQNQAEAAAKKPGTKPTEISVVAENAGTSKPIPNMASTVLSKRKSAEGQTVTKKKSRTKLAAKKATGVEGVTSPSENITFVELQNVEGLGCLTLYLGSNIIPPDVEKSRENIVAEAEEMIPQVSYYKDISQKSLIISNR